MSPELLAAVRERIQHGYTDEQIQAELVAAGHDGLVIEEVLRLAHTDGGGATTPVSSVALPQVMTLITEGIAYVKKRPELVAVLAVPALLLALLEYFRPITPEFLWPLSIATFLVVVVNLFCTMAVLYIVAKSEVGEPLSLSAGFDWTYKNVGGLLWLIILSFVLVWGGFWPFIIPGIIVSFYIYFAQYVYINENIHGFKALLRSRQLVYGDAWAVAGKVVGVGFVFVVLYMAVVFVFGLLATLLSGVSFFQVTESVVAESLLGFFGQVAGAVLTVIGFSVAAKLYHVLSAQKPYDETTLLVAQKRYQALAIWGALVLVLTVAVLARFVVAEKLKPINELTAPTEEVPIEDFDAKERAAELRLNQ
jgi:hypothetical protein